MGSSILRLFCPGPDHACYLVCWWTCHQKVPFCQLGTWLLMQLKLCSSTNNLQNGVPWVMTLLCAKWFYILRSKMLKWCFLILPLTNKGVTMQCFQQPEEGWQSSRSCKWICLISELSVGLCWEKCLCECRWNSFNKTGSLIHSKEGIDKEHLWWDELPACHVCHQMIAFKLNKQQQKLCLEGSLRSIGM